MFPVTFWSMLVMADVRVLLDSVNVLLGSINWAITSLSENATSVRLYSSEEKYCCSSGSLLACWKPACVAFNCCSYLNLLYYNAENILKLAHFFLLIGFLRKSWQAYIYIYIYIYIFQKSSQHDRQFVELVPTRTVCLTHYNIVPCHWWTWIIHRSAVMCPRVGHFYSFLFRLL